MSEHDERTQAVDMDPAADHDPDAYFVREAELEAAKGKSDELRDLIETTAYHALIDGGMLVKHEREWEDAARSVTDALLPLIREATR